jgi:acyl-coenzyme A synthetase/AMP-(fatty) acid ligase
VHFVDDLPRSEAGKLVKAELKVKYGISAERTGASAPGTRPS